MSIGHCPRPDRRTGFRWLLVLVGFFAYLLLLAWERVETRERSSQLECLEQTLEQRKTDEALRRVQIEKQTDFVAVLGLIEEESFVAASPDVRILVQTDPPPNPIESPETGIELALRWFDRVIRGEVAQARPSVSGRSDVEGAE